MMVPYNNTNQYKKKPADINVIKSAKKFLSNMYLLQESLRTEFYSEGRLNIAL